ncbi:lysophospholipid hydrolase, partial [Lecanoromycetidae sp. Uapishka_2]
MYARLPPEPQRKEPQIDLFSDTQDGDSKPGLANYLDEFLSAIKVFGYLERSVFHELTRTMQTRKLIAGETLLLEEEKGFCLVVDGMVQIFVKSTRNEDNLDGRFWTNGGEGFEDEGEHLEGEHQGYQLLTEVKNGAPMSSLFSVLSLFTEDVKLRHDQEHDGRPASSASNHGFPATAFHRLTRVYPKATAHIVQVILTRLQRVTLATAHSYLGLTSEVLRTERHMNRYTTYDLPNHLRGNALDRLKDKFRQEKERLESPEEGMKGIALHNPGSLNKRRSSSILRKEIAEQARREALRTESHSKPFEQRPSISGSQERPLDRRTSSGRKRTQLRKSLFLIKPGGLAGYVGTISSYRSFVDVRAKTDVYVGFLPRASLELMAEKYPVVLLTMAKRLTSLLPRLILHIDFALEWVQVDAGQVIHHQGDESDAIYIVLNGRLRSISEQDGGQMRVVGEYGQGESVGELEVMTESVRPATLHAIRDTELAKFPKSLFNSLALEHPGITIKISKIIAQRMRALIEDPVFEQRKDKMYNASKQNATSTMNLRTTAILPVTAGVPVVEFGSRLLTALSQIGVANGVTSLNQAAILNHLGRHAFSRMGKLKLSQYLADLEERYGMLLYVADTNVNSPWTQTCITQADCILLVGLAEGSPSIGEYERFLLGMKTTARKELVLLHAERYSPPGLTRKWLRNRMWINGGHHHIQMAFRTSSEPVHSQIKRFGTTLKQRVQVLQAEIQKYTSRRIRQTPLYSAETPFKGDFHRLARRLCGKSVGLVLGGGGARGISQVGVIRALEEAGIPIDIIGGTSIGAFIGALYARDADVVPMYGRAKKFAGRMGSMWRFALDLTYPSASYTTGHEFNRGIFKTFGNSQMEDFWLEFYCNTTNISKSRAEFHNSGYVWRYVRASMSLAGLLPPLCDEGSMLLDGGYVDNLTVAHMKSLGADVIFAVDVGSLDDNLPQTFGDSLSGAWALMNRWNPFSNYQNPPTLSEIQARLAYVSSVDALERAKTMPGCLYMRPPIDPYGTLDFAKFDEIYQVGYSYGQEFLGDLREKGLLPVMAETEEGKGLRRTMAPRRASV